MIPHEQLELYPAPVTSLAVTLTRGLHRGEVDLRVAAKRSDPTGGGPPYEIEQYDRLTVGEAADVLEVWLSVLGWSEG
jgi:hypothetical protein